MSNILSIDKVTLDCACERLEIESFELNEYEFLKSYQTAIKPVAITLKALEANSYSFGIFLPTLIGLRAKLATIENTVTGICHPLINALQEGFERRFKNELNLFNANGISIPLYIAMASNPKYKLNYLNMTRIPSHIYQRIRKIMINAAVKIIQSEKTHNTEAEPAPVAGTTGNLIDNCDDINSLLISNDVTMNIATNVDIESIVTVEIENYLTCPVASDINDGLKSFPMVQKLFRKFNSIRSTEAICERMFSYAGLYQLFIFY